MYRYSLICMWFVAIVSISGESCLAAASSSKNANEYLRNAQNLIDHGMYTGAIEQLRLAEQEQADNPDIYNLLGFCHRKLRRYEAAQDYYRQALQLDPAHKGALEYLGELYVETGRVALAREQLDKLDDACLFKCKEYKQLKKLIEAQAESQL